LDSFDPLVDPVSVPAPSRFRIRFSLRSILGLIVLASAVLFLWIGPALQQRRIVDLFHQNEMQVEYSPKPALVPQWLYDWAGQDFFSSISRVDQHVVENQNRFPFVTKLEIPNGFQGESLKNAFPNVNTVTLHNPDNVQFLVHLKKLESIWDRGFREEPYPRLPNVKTLMAGYHTELFDCNHVNSFPNLRSLIVSSKFKNSETLTNNKRLESLKFGNYRLEFEPVDLEPISELSELKLLMLIGVSIDDLSPLQKLSNLEQLEIGGTSRANLNELYAMAQLKHVILGKTFSKQEVESLSEALPNCKIRWP
jgi:hypothetical protein